MVKKIVYYRYAKQALEKGIEILFRVIKLTLGPNGKSVVFGFKSGVTKIVSNGRIIAREIELSNVIENTGVALIRQAALKTNDIVGDGVTTSIILAREIIKRGVQSVAIGYNPVAIKKGIEKSVDFIVSKILEYSRPVQSLQDVVNIASVAAGNDLELGYIIARAIEVVGIEGVISLDETLSSVTSLEVVEGLSFNKGFISPYFIADSQSTVISQDHPYILLIDKKIKKVQRELIFILEQVAKTGRPLLIVAEDIDKEALSTLLLNKLKNIVNVVAVRAPGFADRRRLFLEDLAVLTGSQVVSDNTGIQLDNFSLDMMGSAKNVKVSKTCTTIMSDNNQLAVTLRCSQIRQQIQLSNNVYEIEKLEERLLRLSSRIAVVKIGAMTETEMYEKKLRLEDAISAARSAIQEGIIPGGGATLVHLSQEMHQWSHKFLSVDELRGSMALEQALCMPLCTIVDNIGLNGVMVFNHIKDKPFEMGYDVNKRMIVNMYNSGIVDSAKITRVALQNGASIASVIITTECLIVE